MSLEAILKYPAVVLAGMLAALLLTPLWRRLAAAWGFMDRPDPRKIHRTPVPRGGGLTVRLLPGQEAMTVPDMPAKIDAQLRGLGVGFLPTCLAQPYIDTGRLVVKQIEHGEHKLQFCYAWRKSGKAGQGRALRWWLEQLTSPVTRAALLAERRS